jgi:hypothetical protein
MMNRPVRRSVLGVVLGLGLAVGTAGAQNNPQAANAEVGQRRTANLSGPDQIRESNAIVTEIQATRTQVSNMLDTARQERDIIKVNCLNDKLTQVDVTLRSAREHQELLSTAVSINNDGQRNHEFTLMSIYRGRTTDMAREAQACIGEGNGTFDQGSRVQVTVSNGITTQDTVTLQPEANTPERPLLGSAVM